MDAIGIQHLSENTARLAQKELSINWVRVMKARSQTRENLDLKISGRAAVCLSLYIHLDITYTRTPERRRESNNSA
jgi:hypothetical protein